ncbi:Sterol-4-alpha-carboxylate 3-dehydrogenase [Escovopsis weberi]|uniref:Sterol-4-alpha-carboxylate 3-dehydrogenase n=1 Tax=Escovopsis weberi TaxID=150374 RepID=A0A0M8MVP2_ESCWE|nr:Sterol-4-alpha-carboxylate 3-dehydrogenase [Escovopsis weberi]
MTAQGEGAPPPAAGQHVALVIGGCGFVGFHIVGHLLADPSYSAVHILDRAITRNLHDGSNVSYTRGHIGDVDFLRALVHEVRPSVVFHTASPPASLPYHRFGEFAETNIEGTRNVIRVAEEAECVRTLVYTSSIDVYADAPHLGVSEDARLWPEWDHSNEYCRTKKVGEALVIGANGPKLRTATMRLGHVYGERMTQGLEVPLELCAKKNPLLVQIGDGKNLMEVASVDNCAAAHLLAAEALLGLGADTPVEEGDHQIDGEAFNISDGAPVSFWLHQRLIWAFALGRDADSLVKDIIIIPAWVMIVLVTVVDWFLWIFTLNIVKPPIELRRMTLVYCIGDVTFSIEKARKRLNFKPVVNHDAVLEKGVRWAMAQRQQKP